jgi:hypothetical protein
MQFARGAAVRPAQAVANADADGVEANARLTSSVALLLLILLAADLTCISALP